MKKSYASPALTTYGSVEQITQSWPWGGNNRGYNRNNRKNNHNQWNNYQKNHKGSKDRNGYLDWCKKYFKPTGS